MKFLSKCYIFIIFAILYAPIFVVVLFSFNESESLSNFSGFSLYWYQELFRDGDAFSALKNSLLLAVSSSALATVIGTFAALGIARARKKWTKQIMESVANIPMMNPDIVTGVSMMLLFVGFVSLLGWLLRVLNLSQNFDGSYLFGFWTMLIAHTTFNLPYVILSVLPKFRQMDKNLTEAALDLGCTPLQTFFRVELPSILPGVLSGLMMSFTLSLDDFVISHFVSSPDFKTLPLYIYTQTAHEVKFSMYALCALMIVVIAGLLLTVNLAGSIGERKQRKDAHAKGGSK
ncbi:MAG: ABC transporter permease [Clostridia bacterium]|nr:ABC transporter permease [Clostridia bacterium]MBR2927408.1 ABC transporter permease [Clostridia bacterium]